MKKALPYILSSGLLVYLIIVLTFADRKTKEVECRGIHVSISGADGNAFIDEAEVAGWLGRHYGGLEKGLMHEADKDSMERVLARNPVIREAEVYSTLDGRFHVDVSQRKPVLRVWNDGGYYLDEDGWRMPLSPKYTARVIVATGRITPDFARKQLYPLALFLKEDRFWNALFEQIVVDAGREILLVPKVGNFRIRLGDLERLGEKMENLRLFLEEGPAFKGWNTYKEINLKFRDQIVCVKR